MFHKFYDYSFVPSSATMPSSRAAGFSLRGRPRRLKPAAQRRTNGRRGFTLIELLVVISVMLILAGAVVVVSTTLIDKAKAQNTQVVLTIVRDAITEFQREQRERPTVVGVVQGAAGYADRYGYFPPDELEVFTPSGLPGSGVAGATLAVGGAVMAPPPGAGYPDMQFRGNRLPPDDQALEHRDLAAMIVAIRLTSEAGGVLLDGIQDRYWSAGSLGADGLPNQFLDRDVPPNGWSADDLQVRYILDDWGVPISYLAQRDWQPPPNAPADSSNLSNRWNQASTQMIRVNGGWPILMSYGPDGKDQLTLGAMGTGGDASLVADWMDDGPDTNRINHSLNADNIYGDPSLKERLAEGIGP